MIQSDARRDVIRLSPEWLSLLRSEFTTPHMTALRAFLKAEKAAGKVIYPPGNEFFAALDATAPSEVRVVVIGQDPYHGPQQAHGLSFSVRKGQPIPPSLRNIFAELEADLSVVPPAHGSLLGWAKQGVLLLNSVLSVEQGMPGSHQGRGWEPFTDAVIAAIDGGERPVVFMLWGKHAQQKGAFIDRQKHCVLSAPHPSPLSAHRGFFGCRHFSQANRFLLERGYQPVDWSATG
jgi:uracil-DNA glycosylase